MAPPTITIQRDATGFTANVDGSWTMNLECGHTTKLLSGVALGVGAQLSCPTCEQLVSQGQPIPA